MTSDEFEVTYQKKLTIRRGSRKADGRAGLQKLKNIVFFLRYQCGYKNGDKIPDDDVEYSIIIVTEGLDRRTIKKYKHNLLYLHYLEPAGHPTETVSRVTVRTFSRIDSSARINPKQYHSPKGYSEYVFGLQAPKVYAETQLADYSSQESLPHESESTCELCVCASREVDIETRETRQTIDRKKEEESTVSRTHNRSTESNILEKNMEFPTLVLSPEEQATIKSRRDQGG